MERSGIFYIPCYALLNLDKMTELELYNNILSIIDSYVTKIGSNHRGIDEDQNCLVTDEVVALVKNHIVLDHVVL